MTGTDRVTVILATIKWDFVWQRHQALGVAAADRSAVVFVESQPRRAAQLLAFAMRLLGTLWRLPKDKSNPSNPSKPTNPRPDGVRLVGASVLALAWPALWARLLARSITGAHPGTPVDVVLYAPTPAYVKLARLLETTGGTVVYDAVVDWDAVPAGWWPPHRARDREVAMPARWRVTSDSASLAGVLSSAMHRPVEVVLPAADPAFASYPWVTGRRSGTVGWFGVVRAETDVDLLARCARSGLAVETIGPVETLELRTTLESAGVLVRAAMGPDELPAAMAHWDAVLCAYQGPRAATITPAKIFNALTGFTVFTRGLRLPEQLAAAVFELPADDDAAVAVIRETLATPPALSGLPGQRSQTWDDRLDQLLHLSNSDQGIPLRPAGAEFLDRAEGKP